MNRIEPTITLVTILRICGTHGVSFIKNEPKSTTTPRINQKIPIICIGRKDFNFLSIFTSDDILTPITYYKFKDWKKIMIFS